MKTTAIYHRADFDGLFCRGIAQKFLPSDTEFIGWDFCDRKVPFPTEGKVYLMDLPPECFQVQPVEPYDLQRLIWIDHHKSAIEKFNPATPGYRIDGVAACRLAWQWFSKGHPHVAWQYGYDLPEKKDFIDRKVSEPLSVRLAGEYDIWDKRDPDAELFQHGLRGVPLTDGMWDELLEPNLMPNLVEQMLDAGRLIAYAKEQENSDIINNYGFTIQWQGLTFLACNHARFNSHLFTAGIKPHHDALLGFKWTGKNWSVSLYHAPGKEQHDLSLIAQEFGGGGHRGACGFICLSLPFPINSTAPASLETQ